MQRCQRAYVLLYMYAAYLVLVLNYLTLWRRNYFFLILAHPIYKM